MYFFEENGSESYWELPELTTSTTNAAANSAESGDERSTPEPSNQKVPHPPPSLSRQTSREATEAAAVVSSSVSIIFAARKLSLIEF